MGQLLVQLGAPQPPPPAPPIPVKPPKMKTLLVSRIISKITEMVLPPGAVTRIRTRREWFHWVDAIAPELFDDLQDAPAEAKRRLFKANVRLVEIEAHAKCNRICSFCPNVILDRRLNNDVADAGMLDRVFAELGSIDYEALRSRATPNRSPIRNISTTESPPPEGWFPAPSWRS